MAGWQPQQPPHRQPPALGLRWGLMSPSKGCECPQHHQGHLRGSCSSRSSAMGQSHTTVWCSALFTCIFQQGQCQDNAENCGSVTCTGAPRWTQHVTTSVTPAVRCFTCFPVLHPTFICVLFEETMSQSAQRRSRCHPAFAHCPPCPLALAALSPPCWELHPSKPRENLGVVFLVGAQQTPARYNPGIMNRATSTHGEHLRPSRWLLSPETTSHSVKESRGTLPVEGEMHTFIYPAPKPRSALSLLKDQSSAPIWETLISCL